MPGLHPVTFPETHNSKKRITAMSRRPDSLLLAVEHIEFMRRTGSTLAQAVAAIGATLPMSCGWDDVIYEYARIRAEMQFKKETEAMNAKIIRPRWWQGQDRNETGRGQDPRPVSSGMTEAPAYDAPDDGDGGRRLQGSDRLWKAIDAVGRMGPGMRLLKKGED
jgi:hypothetical protein